MNRWLEVRSASGRDSRHGHLVWFIVSACLALPPIILPLDAVRLDFGCLFQHITRIPCVFCGYTRAFSALGCGEWRVAFYWAPLAPVLFVLAWAVMLTHLTAILFHLHVHPGSVWQRRSTRRLVWALAVGLLLIDWSYRIALSLGFSPFGLAAVVAN